MANIGIKIEARLELVGLSRLWMEQNNEKDYFFPTQSVPYTLTDERGTKVELLGIHDVPDGLLDYLRARQFWFESRGR